MKGKREKARTIPIASERARTRSVPWYAAAVVLAILVLSVYWQVGGHDFVNFDDDRYVYENPPVLGGLTRQGIAWAFTTFHGNNWSPLTWLSYMADIALFGLDAGWYHRVNMLLHLANTVLLFLVLWRMTGALWQSGFVAALFGVHPLHVESVAWVAERKDVLSTLFWVLTIGAYARYARRPSLGRYLAVGVFLALGLMCKPMLVTLPFVLLLLDWWPLGRFAPADPSVPLSRRDRAVTFGRLVREKLPLLGLSALSSAITYLAQTMTGAASQIKDLTLGSRVSNAIVSCAVYLWKMIWPSSLAAFYPHPAAVHAGIPAWQIGGAALLLCGLTVTALRQRHGRPYLAVGWLWYLGTLVPVIGLIQTGMHARADRFTYVPLIGIFIAIAWGVPSVLSGWRLCKPALAACGGAVVLALTAAAWTQAGYWRDTVTLWSRALAVTNGNWLAMNNLGDFYFRLGQYQHAAGYFQEAVRVRPDYADAWRNLGVSRQALGQHEQAVGCLQEALRIMPDHLEARRDLGDSYFKLGRHREAIGAYREALRSRPGDAETWNLLGVSYGTLGQYQQAIEAFQEALRIKPDHAGARENLANASARAGQGR